MPATGPASDPAQRNYIYADEHPAFVTTRGGIAYVKEQPGLIMLTVQWPCFYNYKIAGTFFY